MTVPVLLLKWRAGADRERDASTFVSNIDVQCSTDSREPRRGAVLRSRSRSPCGRSGREPLDEPVVVPVATRTDRYAFSRRRVPPRRLELVLDERRAPRGADLDGVCAVAARCGAGAVFLGLIVPMGQLRCSRRGPIPTPRGSLSVCGGQGGPLRELYLKLCTLGAARRLDSLPVHKRPGGAKGRLVHALRAERADAGKATAPGLRAGTATGEVGEASVARTAGGGWSTSFAGLARVVGRREPPSSPSRAGMYRRGAAHQLRSPAPAERSPAVFVRDGRSRWTAGGWMVAHCGAHAPSGLWMHGITPMAVGSNARSPREDRPATTPGVGNGASARGSLSAPPGGSQGRGTHVCSRGGRAVRAASRPAGRFVVGCMGSGRVRAPP